MSDTTYNKYQHYGTAAERAAFTPSPPAGVKPIYIWYETDTGNTYLYHTSWIQLNSSVRRQITLVIDGGSSVITTGQKGYISLPVAGTLKKWRILSLDGTTGSIVIDVWKDVYANFAPTVADTITAAAKPTLTTDVKAESSTLTGWTTAFSAGDIFGFNVDSVTSVKKVSLVLEFE